jgi:hypothetical protein
MPDRYHDTSASLHRCKSKDGRLWQPPFDTGDGNKRTGGLYVGRCKDAPCPMKR